MTRILILGLAIVLAAGPAAAQHSLGIFSSAQQGQCNIYDTGPGLFSAYIIHWQGVSLAGATGARFSAPVPACATGVSWAADISLLGMISGNSQTGATVRYGSTCLDWLQIPVMRIDLWGNGLTQTCCAWQVQPFPGAQYAEYFDCYGNPGVATPWEARINPSWQCDCAGWVPVEHQSWGSIKALYEE